MSSGGSPGRVERGNGPALWASTPKSAFRKTRPVGGRGTWNLFERARLRMSTTRLAPARRLWRGGGHVGVVGAAKLGSDLEATNRAVGVSGSAHTKAALARGRDAVVEGDRSVVEADVEERRLLGVNDGGLAQDGLRRRRLVQEAVGRRQEQGSYEIGLRF